MSERRRWKSLSSVAGRLILGAAIALGAVPSAWAQSTSVKTPSGTIEGVAVPGYVEFLGIPYAAPPIGALRWMPPQPAAPLADPFQATSFAPHCAQVASPFGIASNSEDCLYLNIYVPDGSSPNPFQRHPVMVWFHGGAFVVGESDDYGASKFIAQNDTIVVTVNYRLGALGFLALPAFAAENSAGITGNYAIQDQQFALKWVRQNIAAFGGDPENVTIFGESAGGAAVVAHLVSPTAAGLFQRAIIESGSALTLPTQASAETQGEAFAAAVGCPGATAACLRAVPVATLLADQGSGANPVIDGHVIPVSPGIAFSDGRFNHVPILNGTNHDEFRLFVALDFNFVGGPITAAEYPAVIAAEVGTAAVPAVMAHYPLSDYPSPDLAVATLITDGFFSCPALTLDQLASKFVPVFAYEFADENAPELFLPPTTFPYGAAHASEIQYLFALPQTASYTAAQLTLSETMDRYWTSFASEGAPDFAVVPGWPRFSARLGNFQSLVPSTPTQTVDFATDHNCAFWAALGGD
jgi:para-nitrobenzyl esterase